MKNSINKLLIYLISFITIYLIFLILYLTKNNPLAFPSPNDIIVEFFKLLTIKSTYINILYSLLRLIICIFISLILNLSLAYLSYKFKFIKTFLSPFIVIFRTIPFISIIILIIIMFGLNETCYITTILVIGPIMYENILNGLEGIDKDIINAYKLDTKFNNKVFFKIYLPLISNDIKTSLKVSIGLGFKVLVTSEYISGKNYSLGFSLKDIYQTSIDMCPLYSQTLILIVISLVITKLVNIIF